MSQFNGFLLAGTTAPAPEAAEDLSHRETLQPVRKVRYRDGVVGAAVFASDTKVLSWVLPSRGGQDLGGGLLHRGKLSQLRPWKAGEGASHDSVELWADFDLAAGYSSIAAAPLAR